MAPDEEAAWHSPHHRVGAKLSAMDAMDEDGLKQAAEDAAEREDEEAGWLEMAC